MVPAGPAALEGPAERAVLTVEVQNRMMAAMAQREGKAAMADEAVTVEAEQADLPSRL